MSCSNLFLSVLQQAALNFNLAGSRASPTRSAVLQLNVKRLPTKVHSICAHLADWCKLSGNGCNKFTDEWIEMSHHDFKTLWESSYQIRDITSPVFNKRHLSAMLRFNPHNIPVKASAASVEWDMWMKVVAWFLEINVSLFSSLALSLCFLSRFFSLHIFSRFFFSLCVSLSLSLSLYLSLSLSWSIICFKYYDLF